jgi:hypothetical protein
MGTTTLVTDEAKGYKQFAGEMKGHETVNHSRDEYVNRNGATTNQAEAYFGQLKRSIDGTHHSVSREHLARYRAQHDFLRSTYKMDDSDRCGCWSHRSAGDGSPTSHSRPDRRSPPVSTVDPSNSRGRLHAGTGHAHHDGKRA